MIPSLYFCVLVMMVCPCRLLVLVLAVLPVQAAGVEALAGGVGRGTGDTSVQGEPGPPSILAGNSLNILLTIDLLSLLNRDGSITDDISHPEPPY